MSKINNLHLIYRSLKSVDKNNPVVIDNNSARKKRVIFANGFRCKNDALKIINEISQDDGLASNAKLLLLDCRFKYVRTIYSNSETVVGDLGKKIYRLAVVIPPKSNIKITRLSIDKDIIETKTTQEFLKTFIGDTLLITPGYPSNENLYNHSFVHSRMKLYEEANIKNIDVAVVNDQNISQTAVYKFENVRVNNMSYNTARLLLLQKKYKRILIHFFSPKYAQVLDASDLSSTQVFIYTHGGDVLYRDYPDISCNYFKDKPIITNELEEEFNNRDSILRRYNKYQNVHWIFATKWSKDRAERFLETKFNRAHIIPNPIPSSVFAYRKRDERDRKKICVVRPFNKLSSYSIDIAVRVIEELSSRPFFSDLEFNIYGMGETHKLLVEPLLKFPNVNIHETFLNRDKLSSTYQDHGILLMPTRYDNNAVSACEASMTGAVVISSDGDIGLKEYIDPTLGTYCTTEDFREYADIIEELYYNKSKFLELSEKTHEFTFKSCSEDYSIVKEVEILLNTKPFNLKLQLKPKNNTPLLTVAIPAYNVENYLKNGVFSLIDQPLANRLEVLIINDGSKDRTDKIGLELEKLSTTKKGPIVKIVNKKNGGHGSAINKGIELATGKYFRLMDGDDYFVTSALVTFLEKLEHEKSDIILTNYVEDFSVDAIKRPVHHYNFMVPGLRYNLDTMHYSGYGFSEWGPLLSTTTCRTNILKNASFKIDEGCFYVDMEYNFITYALSKTITYYPLDIYSYYLGRVGQSMTRESLTRNVLHHEKVTLRLLEEFYSRNNDLSDSKKSYIENRLIVPMCKAQYSIVTDYASGNKPFLSFDKKLKKYNEFYYNRNIAGRLIRLHRATNGCLIKMHNPIKKVSSRIKSLVGITKGIN